MGYRHRHAGGLSLTVWLMGASAILLLLAVGCWLFFWSGSHDFSENARMLLETNADTARRFAGFSQEKALAKLGSNAFNDFYYRFDDHVQQALYTGSAAGEIGDSALFDLEFTAADRHLFTIRNEQAEISNGLLRIESSRNGCLETTRPLNIDGSDVSEVLFRLKAQKSNALEFGWSEQADADWRNNAVVNKVRLDIRADGAFHEYRVNIKERLSLVPTTIRKLFLQLSTVSGDQVELDYLRLVSRENFYKKENFGSSYEKKRNQVRRVIFCRTPGMLRFGLTLPEKRCWLRFGCGVIKDNQPVDVAITVRHRQGEETIFAQQIDSADQWHDRKLDLTAYAGQHLEILFSANSRQESVVFWSNPAIYSLPGKRTNVIVVLEDALRSDHMSCYGYARKTTPIKEKWMKSGVRFDKAYAQGTVTITSVPSLMTSLYPTATGVWHPHDKLQEEYLTLAEILRHQGFETASFLLNPAAGYMAGLHQGFSRVYDPILGRAERLYNIEVPRWIEKHGDRNFFLYLHVLDPHGPFDPPAAFNQWYDAGGDTSDKAVAGKPLIDPYWVASPSLESRRALYDGEIYYNDHWFAAFLENLKELGVYEDTLIIFMADHGEHLGEHGLWGHRPPGFVQGIKTPLIMSYPGKLPAGREIAAPVQNIDIFPTILDLLGINTTLIPCQGRSLVPLIRGKDKKFWKNRVALSDEVFNRRNKNDFRPLASAFYRDHHLICSSGLGVMRFDLGDDPQEIRGIDLVGQEAANYRKFIQNMQNGNMRIRNLIITRPKAGIEYDPETVRRLKALGYLAGGDTNREPSQSTLFSQPEMPPPADGTPAEMAPQKKDNRVSPGGENPEVIFKRQLQDHIDSLARFSVVEKSEEYQRLCARMEMLLQDIPQECRNLIFQHLQNYPPEEVYYFFTHTGLRHQRQTVLDLCLSTGY